ncbi:hypothetical protein HWV23_15715 [Natronomonas halophila]|uniref:beta barrel domain-containing protein n=1 Tax=Natronomonas halophila TaxID=2747817 RepID=UPI0015B4EF90|nr:hypothetical protein [Natronomonas halophila]QLD87109.1 hypothetical protein HWV23_15715 [Natronomonas halophila]
MSDQTTIVDEPKGEGYRTRLSSDAVRVGDTVVWTSKLNKEYRFTVATVDSTWITFQTGQMVHKDRFDREDFVVVRTDEEASPAAETGGQEPTASDGPAIEESSGMQASMSDTD